MRIYLVSCIIFLNIQSFAQTNAEKWLRAFPVTSYLIDLNDSVKLVQIQMPDGMSLADKQPGLIYGVYSSANEKDTSQKGYGRCQLIKGDYYYFAIGHNESGVAIKKGDLLYTFMNKTNIYVGKFPGLAMHYIALQDVYEHPLYDRYTIFYNWTEEKENALVDSIVSDIRFTGDYFTKNRPSLDKPIKSGRFNEQKVFAVMAGCQAATVYDFLDYVVAHPRLYAGRSWKVAEIFATWLAAGAPGIAAEKENQ